MLRVINLTLIFKLILSRGCMRGVASMIIDSIPNLMT